MINSWKIYLYSLLITLGFGIFVLVESYWFDQLYQNPISPSLYKITVLDKELNENLIKSHQFTVKNYDFIGGLFRKIDGEIQVLSQNKMIQKNEKSLKTVKILKEKYEEKYSLVDYYARSNSLAINSINYLPELIREAQVQGSNKAFNKYVQESTIKLYEYYSRPNNSLRERLLELREKLARRFKGQQKEQYLNHFNIILEKSLLVKSSIKDSLDINVQESINSLRQLDSISFRDKISYNRFIIFGFSFLLVALGIVFKIILIRKTNKEMNIKKQLDEQIAKNNNNAKMAALGEMAGQIAHEINTPLGTLVLISQTLVKKSLKGTLTSESLSKQLGVLLEITGKISKIIKTMKDFARSGVEVQHEDSSIQRIIDDVLLLSGQKIKKTGADLEIIYEVEEDRRLNCCSFQIVQVLLNMLSNSLNALEKVEERWVKIKLTAREELFRVEFLDSGEGVPEEAKDKIFDHKFTTKALGEGTGIGLALSKQIIEEHEGILYLDSSQPHTTFVFEIPFNMNREIKEKVA